MKDDNGKIILFFVYLSCVKQVGKLMKSCHMMEDLCRLFRSF